jgi:excisionase family DNA binding protein
MNLATLNAVAKLQVEMEQSGRLGDSEALRSVLRSFAGRSGAFITTGGAARRLGISIPTVKRWIARGTLQGGAFGGRWLVAEPSVERIVGMRSALAALAEDGDPTPEEIANLFGKAVVDISNA